MSAERWCILRCSNCKTLELAASLCEAGFVAWTPAETISRRSRRSNKREEVRQALIPSFVFASADRLLDLLALSHTPTLNYQVWDSEKRRMVTKGHPYFRLFRQFGDIRLVPAAELEPLRKIEGRRRPKGKPRGFSKGSVVRFTEGGFAGLRGIVDASRGDYTTVIVDDWAIPVQVSTWLLHPDLDDARAVHVSSASSEQALIAKAA